ncbi:unnamed protein product [Scytosiphon promiscuus]
MRATCQRRSSQRNRGGGSPAVRAALLIHAICVFRSFGPGCGATATPARGEAKAGDAAPDEAEHGRTLTFEPVLGEGEIASPPAAAPPALFSEEWARQYARGDAGCDLARGSFMWRGQGFGSNMNNLLNAWVYAIAVEGWSDMAVVISPDQMGKVECGERSNGKAFVGWDCLFNPMPHLCTFRSDEAWEEHMISKHFPRGDLAEAVRLDQDAVRFHPEEIVAALEGSGVDHIGALAVMAEYLWSNVTPWLQDDVDAVVNAPPTDAFRESPFLGLHIRRGDKVTSGEAALHPGEEYLGAAVAYLEGDESGELGVEDIKGIWVASDDSQVVDKIKGLAPSYLPGVDNSTIFWASGGIDGGPEVQKTATRTDKQTYAGFVYALADLQQLTAADVFVGTYSSNLGRLLVLLRDSVGEKDRASAMSVDSAWFAGRRQKKRRA